MAPKPSWKSFELVWPQDGDFSRPVTDALADSSEGVRMLKLMSRVEELGWSEAQKLKIGTKNKAKKRIIVKDDRIYLLKGTPLCWRLYLYVTKTPDRIIYLHAVCKKQDAEDPGDHVTARQRFDDRAAGGLAEITFPS